MDNPRPKATRTVVREGANPGCILRGVAAGNRGLRIRIFEQQPKGGFGPIQGRFVLLAAGDNKHSAVLGGLVGKETDAPEVLRLIREDSPGCLSVVNTNILVLEGQAPAGG
jgi:hypothetical protein